LKGSEGKLVVIYIWKASTREVLAKIFGFHRRAIKNLKFFQS
jgi:transcription initiation factor IIE alpha subunit